MIRSDVQSMVLADLEGIRAFIAEAEVAGGGAAVSSTLKQGLFGPAKMKVEVELHSSGDLSFTCTGDSSRLHHELFHSDEEDGESIVLSEVFKDFLSDFLPSSGCIIDAGEKGVLCLYMKCRLVDKVTKKSRIVYADRRYGQNKRRFRSRNIKIRYDAV